MPHIQPATADVIPFPNPVRRPLRFSKTARQALLALTYAVPGTGVDLSADLNGDEYACLGAANFEEGAWWTVLVTAAGYDVINFTGYRVARFAAIEPLVERMRPHMAHMLGLSDQQDEAQANDDQGTASRFLTVV